MTLSIGKKLGLSLGLLAVASGISFIALAMRSVSTARESFVEQRFDQLVAARNIKQQAVSDYLEKRFDDIEVLANSADVRELLNGLHAFRDTQEVLPKGAFPVDGSEYETTVGPFQDYFSQYIRQIGYYDVFLISKENGHVMFTEAREADVGSNLDHGPYRDSGLAKVWRRAVSEGRSVFEDFQPYAPSNHEPAAFLGTPIRDESGAVAGVLALQISIDTINRIMTERSGMGESGETYLVGSDLLMRSDSYLDPQGHSVKGSFADPTRGSVDTEAARAALDGDEGSGIIVDYNGNPVLSAWAPLDFAGVRWAILAEIDEKEVVSESTAAAQLLNSVLAIGAIGGIAMATAIVMAGLIARNLIRSLRQLSDGIASGSDEVTAASTELSSASQSLADGASKQSASIEETSSSLEEIAAMTRENAESAEKAHGHMEAAIQAVAQANTSMKTLITQMAEISQASEQTQKIIKDIDEIAFSTNLLALNAAVEAARAGEAGAGFAVVADEVRNLAMRAASAAKDTSALIQSSVENINNGNELAQQTSQCFADVDASSLEAGKLIKGIAAASSDQAQGVEQINRAVSEVDQITQRNAASSEECASTAEEMTAQAEQLRLNVQALRQLIDGTTQPSTASPTRHCLPPSSSPPPDTRHSGFFAKQTFAPEPGSNARAQPTELSPLG
ncbi:MAG: methyl-accepting chemotaxis protein [Opitutales bacterium]